MTTDAPAQGINLVTSSQTPAGVTPVAPAGPAPDRLRTLADEWAAEAARMQAAHDLWMHAGEREYAHIAIGRARQLNDCATELRAALEDS